MSNQYFENNENLKSDIFEINYYFKNHTIKFISDAGVFSRKGIDFGSSLLLKTICIKESTKTILDVGCGYGTLGITLGLTNPNTTIDMVDVNLRALDLTRKNALANSVNNVNIYESNMYENVNKNFDMIVTNPPIRAGKKIVHGIILDAYDHLNVGGSMWCVIQKKQGAESAIKALKEKYKDVRVVCKDKLYYIIEAIR
ncbi:MAG: class I SAM-dependent methyltransferase [Mollicutes bacterium]|nr:class I SAM-dependent methyltransferase [Mollicutes bacterium]